MIDLFHVPVSNAPSPMVEAARRYEERFCTEFATLTWFPRTLLKQLHQPLPGRHAPPNAAIAAVQQPSVLRQLETISTVANTPSPDFLARAAYRRSLEVLFRALRDQPFSLTAAASNFCVAPQREGALLATRLGYLKDIPSLTPEAKRIPYDSGLLVGLSEVVPPTGRDTCLLVDGAIASGATLVAIIHHLCHVRSFRIYAAHSAMSGLWALYNYGQQASIEIRCAVGEVSGTLNEDYFSVYPSGKLVLGDVGDTIASLGSQ